MDDYSSTPSNHFLEYNPFVVYDADQYSLSCLNEEENDCPGSTLKFISDMLMEEEDELENAPSTLLQNCFALQATERSFYDALHNNIPEAAETEECLGPLQRGERKNRSRDDSDHLEEEEQRSNKQLAGNVGETESFEMFDNVLLSTDLQPKVTVKPLKAKRSVRGRRRGGNDIDLHSLLMQCAQCIMGNFRKSNASDLLVRIRQHSSPRGDHTERVAHYLANALEARLAGTGPKSYAEFNLDRISAVEILGAFKACFKACPYMSMTILLANKTIEKLSEGRSSTLHIIDFGILYGFQWPTLIQALSKRRGGPPKLRITGIELPQKGPRPTQRVEETGRRLAKYCERFGVPFEYTAIAQKWETIRIEDIEMEENELRVVNTLNRLQNMLDEPVKDISPRDVVLKLIKNINPNLFIHGVINGPYSTPFFFPRFKEALFHFSSMFDMLESTLHQEDPQRLLIEQIQGSEAMNILACEGMERVERPETYKQWQIRNVRAGFRQVPFDQEIVKYVRSKEEAYYHTGFSVEENTKWILHGWKGRVIRAISCWKPAHNT